MIFQEKLIKGKFIKRYKRFFADIELEDGSIVTAHCPNTGSMKSLLDWPGAYISANNNPTRKLKYTLQLLKNGDKLAMVNTHLTNHIAVEAIKNASIVELANYDKLQTEVNYGNQNSRIDILLTEEDGSKHYIEVKGVTLAEGETSLFPDAVTTRGQKHLTELTDMINLGHKATMLYIINRNDCSDFSIASEIDPKYNELLNEGIKKGLQVLAYSCYISEEEIRVNNKIKFIQR